MKKKDDSIPRISRKEALAGGSLIDASGAALEAGFCQPVALTRRAWERYVEVPPGAVGETEGRRLRELLQALRFAAERAEPHATSVSFTLWVHDGEEMQYCGLRAVGGRGDDRERVITVMDGTEQ